jgi:hypothetical protein
MSKEGGWMEHRSSKTFLNMTRVGGRFEIYAEVKGESNASGFQGQANLL